MAGEPMTKAARAVPVLMYHHISTSPGGILAQYGEQATAGAVDGVRRIGAVLAVNAVEQLIV